MYDKFNETYFTYDFHREKLNVLGARARMTHTQTNWDNTFSVSPHSLIIRRDGGSKLKWKKEKNYYEFSINFRMNR